MGTFFGLEHYVVCIGRGSHGEITAECSREEGGKLESAIQVPSNKKTECFLDALSPKDRLRLLYRVYEECEDASLWMDRFALLDSATDKQLVSQTEKDIRRANEDFAATPAGEDHKSFFKPITEDIRRLYARGLYEKVVELGVHCLCLFMNQMEWFQFDVADGSEKIRDFTLKAFERANLSHAERLVYEARLYHSTRSYWYFSTNKKTLWPHPKKYSKATWVEVASLLQQIIRKQKDPQRPLPHGILYTAYRNAGQDDRIISHRIEYINQTHAYGDLIDALKKAGRMDEAEEYEQVSEDYYHQMDCEEEDAFWELGRKSSSWGFF